MAALLELQQAMRRALFEPQQAGLLDQHLLGDAGAAASALAIYRHTCVSSLANALRLSYPAVQRLVGVEFFDGAAQIFIDRGHLPTGADLNAYGASFPDFLAQFAPAASVPYLADVARLEWAVNGALHAPDVAPMELAQLAALTGAELAQLRLLPHPSLGLLRLDHPADVIWRAVLDQDDAAMAAVALAGGPVWLLIERTPDGVQVMRLAATAWHFMVALCAGQSLAAAIDAAAGADLERVLAEHLAAGRFIGFVRRIP